MLDHPNVQSWCDFGKLREGCKNPIRFVTHAIQRLNLAAADSVGHFIIITAFVRLVFYLHVNQTIPLKPVLHLSCRIRKQRTRQAQDVMHAMDAIAASSSDATPL